MGAKEPEPWSGEFYAGQTAAVGRGVRDVRMRRQPFVAAGHPQASYRVTIQENPNQHFLTDGPPARVGERDDLQGMADGSAIARIV